MDLMGDTLTRPVAVTPVRLTFRSVNMSQFHNRLRMVYRQAKWTKPSNSSG